MSRLAVLVVSLALSWGAPAEPSDEPYELPAGSVVERLIDGPDDSVVAFYRDAVVFRMNALGFDPYFQTLRRSDIGGLGASSQGVTSVRMGPGGTIEVEGAFTSIRGQPRAGRARLKPDGSLDG